MRLSARSRRSAAAFYVTAIGAIIGTLCMTGACTAWVRDGTPEIALGIVGLAALLLATLAVLRDERTAAPASAAGRRPATPARPAGP